MKVRKVWCCWHFLSIFCLTTSRNVCSDLQGFPSSMIIPVTIHKSRKCEKMIVWKYWNSTKVIMWSVKANIWILNCEVFKCIYSEHYSERLLLTRSCKRSGTCLTLIEQGSWTLLESGGGLNQPAPSRSPQTLWKTKFLFWFSESSLGIRKSHSRPLFSWRNSHLKKVRADSAPPHPKL